MPPTVIDSLQNPRVKGIKALSQKRQRDHEGLFVLEGERELERGLASGLEASQLFLCSDLFKHGEASESLHQQLLEGNAPVVYLTRKVFEHVSYRENPDGFLATCKTFRNGLKDLKLSAKPLLLVLEAVEKPGNLGNILRTADACGVDAVIINDPVTDLFNPNVIRASSGVVFEVPVAVASAEDTLAFLQTNGIGSFATTPAAKDLYHQASLNGPAAILLGSEKDGLSDFWIHHSDRRVRIPLLGRADSLNVSTSTAIVLYEALRQRGME